MDSVSNRSSSQRYADTSQKTNEHEVIEVENTVSPKALLGAPKDVPLKDWPVFR
jgi:hypothetical protein